MFDIHEYYIGEPGGSLKEIEEQVTEEIDTLLKAPPSLYTADRFKKHGLCIDILTPSLDYPNGRYDYIDSGSIRFQLSVYPEIETIYSIEKILVRPRHIECAGVELVSLYIPSSRTIVMYLHCPHNYTFSGYHYDISTEPFNLASIAAPTDLGTGVSSGSGAELPPLMYVISTISRKKPEDMYIDKFLFKTDSYPDQQTLVLLDEISVFYSKNGY